MSLEQCVSNYEEDVLGLDDIDLPSDLFDDGYDVFDPDNKQEKYGTPLNKIALAATVFEPSKRTGAFRPPKYKTYGHRLVVTDDPKEGIRGSLSVKCKSCGEHFTPTYIQVTARVQALEGKATIGTENNFYCSEECKGACPLYRFNTDSIFHKPGTIERDSTYMNQVKGMALERAEYQCEICGKEDDLEIHHIEPFKTDPYYAYDLDNLIVLCEDHHKEFGHPVDDSACSKYNLRFLESKTCF